MASKLTLICFAVKEEARPFRRYAKDASAVQVLVTGMGRRNAARAFENFLANRNPSTVITAGYAGGLNPALTPGTVLFSLSNDFRELQNRLEAAGASQGSFVCSDQIAVTSEDKRKLSESSGADAVEMESEEIVRLCREKGLPVATVRVILDPAHQDLPLDFNELVTSDMNMDPWKLGLKVASSPRLIPRLMRFQK